MDRERTGTPGHAGARRRRSVLRRSGLVIVGGGISVTLLFWAKLRVVTNIPRTTYAEPSGEERAAGETDEPTREAPDARDDGEDR